MDRFPLGRAPLILLVVAVASGLVVYAADRGQAARAPDLVVVTASPTHAAAYRAVVPRFERQHGLTVDVQLVNWQALKGRLRNALLAGREVGDLVELQANALGVFTSGPLDEVGFVDVRPLLERDGLSSKLLPHRLALWTVGGRTLAVPHDSHPVVLAYRRDLVASLGIDVERLETWDDFVAMGRSITRDLDGDGLTDRYAIDFGTTAVDLRRFLAQLDADIVGPDRRLRFEGAALAEGIAWYARQTAGPHRIATACGWGQSYAKCLIDGLALFFPMADWRTRMMEDDAPQMSGRMAVLPLPAWRRGGRRTSTEGGTGMAIAKTSRHPELAWELLKFLYFDEGEMGARFQATHVLPPLPATWELPELAAPSPFFSGTSLVDVFAKLAPTAPTLYTSPLEPLAEAKLEDVYRRAVGHLEAHGDAGLEARVAAELTRVAAQLDTAARRNRLAAAGAP